MNKVAITNEFATAILSKNIKDDDVGTLKIDAKGFLETELNLSLASDAKLSVVENDDSNIHLTLPYYSVVEEANVVTVNEADIEDVAGGEFIFVLPILAATTAWAGIGYLADMALDPDKYNADGSLRK